MLPEPDQTPTAAQQTVKKNRKRPQSKTIHGLRPDGITPICGSKGASLRVTTIMSEITCPNCLPRRTRPKGERRWIPVHLLAEVDALLAKAKRDGERLEE